MKNIYGSAWCLILVSSLSIVACSPPDEDKIATAEQKPAIQKLDFGRAPLPTELEPLKKLADAGDAKAAHSLAGWYLNQDYEFFDPQKAYELGYIIEKFEPSDGLNIRANAIGKGATPKRDESEESLRKKAEALPSKKVKFNILEAETRHLLLGRQRTLAKEKTLKMASKTGSQALANIANHWPTISNKARVQIRSATLINVLGGRDAIASEPLDLQVKVAKNELHTSHPRRTVPDCDPDQSRT